MKNAIYSIALVIANLASGSVLGAVLEPREDNVSLRSLTSNEMTCIMLHAKNGWDLEIRANGSARIRYGGSGLDSAHTLPGTIDFGRLKKLVEDDIKAGSPSSDALVSAAIKSPGQEMVTLVPMSSTQMWNEIVSKLNGKLINGFSQKYFDELVARLPPTIK